MKNYTTIEILMDAVIEGKITEKELLDEYDNIYNPVYIHIHKHINSNNINSNIHIISGYGYHLFPNRIFHDGFGNAQRSSRQIME